MTSRLRSLIPARWYVWDGELMMTHIRWLGREWRNRPCKNWLEEYR